jgi:cytochrome P450
MASSPPTTNNPSPKHRLPPTVSAGGIRELVRNPLQFFQGIVLEYGDIVCYRPAPEPAYLLNHPDYIRHVLVDNNRNYTKDTYSNRLFERLAGEGLLTSEGQTWRRQRRMMQPSFHHLRLEQMDGMIVDCAVSMLERWQTAFESNRPIDIAREMAALTLTVTTRALFGVDLGEEARKAGEVVNRAASYLEKPSNPQFVQAAREFGEIVDRVIRQRRENFREGGDLLSSLMLARDENGAPMDEEQLHTQVMTLMLAGYETTSSALTWTWHLLAQNLWAIDRLRSEVRQVLQGRPPRYADLENMSFISMVLDESLRLYPPAWTLGRRATGDDEIGGYYVPANTVIAICLYTLHRHPGFWEQPDVFDPGRFSGENSRGRHKFAYIPFGAGPRQCIGNNFGLLEAALVIACVLQRFELHLLHAEDVHPQAIFVLRPHRDVMMSLHP